MLIQLLRLIFIILCALVGGTSGHYFYGTFSPHMPAWSGAALGFAIAVTIIAAEQGFKSRFNRSIVIFLVGLTIGLILSYLMLTVLDLALQNQDLKNNLDLPVTLVTTYLVLITTMRNADRFRLVIPFVEFRQDQLVEGSIIVDETALGDGRFAGLVEAGLADRQFIIHRQVVNLCETLARSDDLSERLRGQRSLEMLTTLRQDHPSAVAIDDTEVPQAENLSDLLIGLARLEGSRLATADSKLAERAKAEQLRVLDINVLGNHMSANVFPGENIAVTIEKEGENNDQGIGFLHDGSMVVVHDASSNIGDLVHAKVIRIHHTRNGRMIFADRLEHVHPTA